VFFDKTKTNVEVYRDGLKLVREAAGSDTFLLGCNIAQNMRTMGGSIGLVDAMRIGPDIKADWSAVVRCATPATYLYFWNGRVWWNDPDCLMLREPLTVENGRAWGSWIAMSGQMNLVSEWLPGLPPERLDIYKRTIPNHHLLTARPVDLLDGHLARVWHLHYGEGDDRRDVVALFNWNGADKAEKKPSGTGQEEPTASEAMKLEKGPVKVTLDVAQLGLPADAKYVAFDYWDNKFVDGFSGKSEFELPPGSCKVIALTRQLDRPQVVSTSRHVSQGAVDLSDVKWDAATQTLSGKSKVVTGDDYELRLDAPKGLTASAVTTTGNGASAVSKQDGRHVRVTIKSPTTGEVAWAVRFGPQSASAK
jgi:hypothetical protein